MLAKVPPPSTDVPGVVICWLWEMTSEISNSANSDPSVVTNDDTPMTETNTPLIKPTMAHTKTASSIAITRGCGPRRTR